MTSTINETNAYEYSDNYSVIKSTGECVGCEHNADEAKALAAYLSNYHGNKYSIRHNGIEAVRAAKQFRNQPFRHHARMMAFQSTGLWK